MVTTRASKYNKTLNTLKAMVFSNDDLLTEILLRLPAKSILRFKSVSKHWLSLLSDRSFTFLFDKLSISPGIFYRDFYIPFDIENRSTPPFCSLYFYPDRRNIKIVQSCNGLLLCSSNIENKYFVINPTIKQFAVIPPLIRGEDINAANMHYMGLAFHQTDCVHYKLVCVYPASLIPDPDTRLYRIQIYSSDTAKWRILSQSFPLSSHFAFSVYGVYWNGAIYWGSCSDPFYFQLVAERLQNLPSPNYHDHGPRPHFFFPNYIGESRGHLHMVENPRHGDPVHLINVYEMLSDHSGWFLKYQIDLHELLEAYTPHDDFEILDIVRGEKDENTFMVIQIPKKIIRYNILNNSFKPIFNFHGSFKYKCGVHRYIEMLGSSKHR